MAKNRPPKVPLSPTRKHLARAEREKVQTRWILIGSAIAVALAFGLLGYGILDARVLQPAQTVATVGDAKITSGEFQQAVKYQRLNLINQYQQTAQTAQLFAGNPDTEAYFTNQMSQIQAQLDSPQAIGEVVLDSLIDDQLIRQEAARRGITVSVAEVDARLEELFGYFPGGTPTPTTTPSPFPTEVPSATPTLSPTELAALTPTVTITPTATLTPTATATTTPTPTTGPSPTATSTATPRPTATPYTVESYKILLGNTLDNFKQVIDMSEAEFRATIEASLLREKLRAAMTADVPHTREEARLFQIVTGDTSTAKEAKAQLESGVEFATVAAQFSIERDAAPGGDMGWLTRDDLDPVLAEVVFSQEIGKISDPIEFSGGWVVLKVAERAERPVDDATWETLRDQQFEDWLTTQRESDLVKKLDLWTERFPTEPALTAAAG